MSHSVLEENRTSGKPLDPLVLGAAMDQPVERRPRSRNDTPASNGHQPMDFDNSITAHQESGRRSAEPTMSKWQVWLPRLKLVIAVTFPVFLETLDYTVVATSQSKIASVFNRLDLQSYIGTSYILGSTVFLPIFASLADIFGRYWAMQTSVVFFIVGSAISTGANSMTALLIGRGIAGIGAAGLLTLVRTVLSDSSSLDDNNAQGALMIIIYTIGYSVGPVTGGALLRTSWRWVFGINLPVCVASAILMAILLPKISKGPQPPQRLQRLPTRLQPIFQAQVGTGFLSNVQRMDLVGAAIFVVFGILILLGLNWGGTERWDQTRVIVCLSVGGFLLIVFIVWEYLVDHSMDYLIHSEKYLQGDIELHRIVADERAVSSQTPDLSARIARITPKFVQITDPILPLSLFKSIDIVATNTATMTSGMVMLGIFYFVAIFFVIVAGRDSASSGAQLLYFAPGIGIGVVISIPLIKLARELRTIIALSNIILPIALALLGQALYEANEKHIMGYMIMTGVGVGVGFGPLAYQARFSQPEDRVAIVVATNQFFRTLGGTIGLAQLSTVMSSRVRSYISDQIISGRITPLQALQIQSSFNSVESAAGGILGLPDALKQITNEAFRDGLRWAFFSLLPWLGLSFILCLFVSKIPEGLNHKPEQAQPGNLGKEKKPGNSDREKKQTDTTVAVVDR